MATGERKIRMLWGLAAAGAVALLILALEFGSSANTALLDRLHLLLPAVPTKVAIVELDADTIETLGWPLQKELYAAALAALHQSQAKAIGADVFFTQHERQSGALGDDAVSPEQLLGLEAQRVGAVFATYVNKGVPPGGGSLFPPTPAASRVACPSPRAGAFARPLLPGLAGKAQTGHVQATSDADGTYRSIAACQPVHDGCVVDLASRLTGSVPPAASCAQPELIPFVRGLADFPRLSFGRLLELSETSEGQAELDAFASGRIVLLGLTDPTLSDFGPTPRGGREPLVTLHANRIDALLAGVRITAVSPGWLVGVSLLLLTFLLWRLERARTLLAAAALFALVALAASALAFRLGPTWLAPAPLLFPALGGCLTAAALAGWRYFRFNLVLNHAFGMYVAPEVLSWLKETGGAALDPAAAQSREVSVLFSDISGYTRLSNDLPAAQVMESLRFYLHEMVAIVKRHGGYVDKINGDGLMVLFGAPRTSATHARDAFECAREMQARALTANARWKEITGADLRIRIGVATGTVFTGNLGGESHFEYSAIGREVNLAARLESKSEVGGILLSEANWAALTEKPPGAWRQVELKGYESQEPVRAWQVPPAG